MLGVEAALDPRSWHYWNSPQQFVIQAKQSYYSHFLDEETKEQEESVKGHLVYKYY